MQKHFNQLTPAEDERLALLMEEAAEVIQVVCKIQRHGYESQHPGGGPTNRGLLEKELGDVLAALELLTHSVDVDQHSIYLYKAEKLENVKRWLHHQ